MRFFRHSKLRLFGLTTLFLVFGLAILIQNSSVNSLAAGIQGTNEALWQDLTTAELNGISGERWVNPLSSRGLRLNQTVLQQLLAQAPLERTKAAEDKQVIIPIPLPNGSTSRFRFVESPIMEPGLAAQFPNLKTYSGQGLDDPSASIRFDLTQVGFHAMILTAGTTIYVDPLAKGNSTVYVSYFKSDLRKAGWTFECLTQDTFAAAPAPPITSPFVVGGATLRTYRLALAATGEYTAFHGGTVAGALAAIVTSVNRVNAVYERDLAVRMLLVANNNQIIYTNSATDPYSNNSGSTMLGQNQSNLDLVIGTANYDIGHVFSTGGGGVASLRSVCSTTSKARGVTGSSQPVGDGFDIDYVAHEMGHQFGGNHTFNGTTSSCGGGNRASSAAYETGSGSTIMAYAGICGAENLQPNSDDYFHVKSLEEISAFINGTGGGCAIATNTGNQPPTVNAGLTYTIPSQTPFGLTAAGNDANGDALTYCWEQYDLGTASPPLTDDGARPIVRSYNPAASPTRVFPRLTDLLANTASVGETLPTTNRTMNFKVTARDNRAGGGGIQDASTQVIVRADAGPFLVTSPNTPVSWSGGSTQTISWNVANTTNAPVSCANVKISLSTNGGLSFPTVLAASVPNTGGAVVNLPNIPTTQARIKVEAVGNIFFDLSNTNFTITPGTGGGMLARKADFDGDGKTDLAVWRGPSSNWLTLRSSNGTLQTGAWGSSLAPYFDVPVPGDYDGDGKTDYAIWRGQNSIWYINRSSDQIPVLDFWGANYAPFFDIPTPGDFDGDGKTDIAVWRPSIGTWFIKRSSDGSAWVQTWGSNGDIPVAGDYDGDGKTDLAVWNGASGNWLILGSTAGPQIIAWGAGYAPYFDVPVPADYDGDGKFDLAIWRGQDSIWYIRKSSDGTPILQLWGANYAPYNDIPTPGDYDGDGKTDIAVWRPTTGTWFVIRSMDGSFLIQNHGQAGDSPIPAYGVR
jgi:hypothetical protein